MGMSRKRKGKTCRVTRGRTKPSKSAKFAEPGVIRSALVGVPTIARASEVDGWLDGRIGQYDEAIARALCAVSAWSYADGDTFAMMLSRLGLPESEFVPISLKNDGLFMDHRALLVQSKDGRLMILCFQGTSPLNIITWLANFSVRPDQFHESGKVHGGFNRAMSLMFPEIHELLEAGGLNSETSTSIAQKFKDRIALARFRRTRPGPLRRYQTIRENESGLGWLRSRLTENWRAYEDEALRSVVEAGLAVGDVNLRSWLDAARRATSAPADVFRDDAELNGLLQRERQRILENEVRKVIDLQGATQAKKPVERLFITGHSLGGALAVLAAAQLYREHPEEMEEKLGGVYTYGQPMVGDGVFAERCQKDFGERIFRHIYQNDVVPHWPPRSAGYFEHVGDAEYESTPNGWAERTGKVRQTWTMLGSLPLSILPWFGEQIPFLSELLREDPIISKLARLTPLRRSLGDHAPINYLHTSYRTPVGVELAGVKSRGVVVDERRSGRDVEMATDLRTDRS